MSHVVRLRARQVLRAIGVGIALLLGLGPHAGSAATTGSARSASPGAGSAGGRECAERLPLGFEANRGQSDERVAFLARGAGYRLFLTAEEAVLAMRPTGAANARAASEVGAGDSGTRGAVLRMRLVGANRAPRLSGVDALPGLSHYLMGDDPAKWRTGIPHYARVRYASVYRGVDLVYYGNGRALEYDFVVAPGADPGAIGIEFAGADSVRIDGGELVLAFAGGEIRQPQPRVYQEVRGARRPVAGRYRLRGGRVGFQIGSYDRGRPLVIDPVLVYSSFLGGDGRETGLGIAVDAAGSTYVTGQTDSTEFPAAETSIGAAGSGTQLDVFVAKFDARGALVYSTHLGGSGLDRAEDIAVDAAGSAYIAGGTDSADFPTTPGAFQTAKAGEFGAFVTKLDPAGSGLVYSTHLGGSGSDFATGIGVDRNGSAYVSGFSGSRDFPTTPGALQSAAPGGFDNAFVVVLDRAGAALAYSTYLGGSGRDLAEDIEVDASGHAYVTGVTDSADFPTTPGAAQPRSGGFEDVFVSKLEPAGDALAYSTYLGGSSIDGSPRLAVDPAGQAYVTGGTFSSDFPVTPDALQGANAGGADAFVTRLDAAGHAFAYSTYLGGRAADGGSDIAVDHDGAMILTGTTASRDFPVTGPARRTSGDDDDAFLVKLDRGGRSLLESMSFGGTESDGGVSLALDPSGGTYVTGGTDSADFPTTPDAHQRNHGGFSDAFIARIRTTP